MNHGAARPNRTGLALLGLILLAAGALGLSRGLGAFGSAAAAQPMVGGGIAEFARTSPWLWPAVVLAGLVLAVLSVSWLVANLRTDRIRRLRVQSEASGVTEVDGRPAGAALAAQVSRYPAVRRAHATLRGSSEAPRLDVGVSARSSADLHDLVTRLHEDAVPNLRTTLGLDRLPAFVRLRLVPGRSPREVH